MTVKTEDEAGKVVLRRMEKMSDDEMMARSAAFRQRFYEMARRLLPGEKIDPPEFLPMPMCADGTLAATAFDPDDNDRIHFGFNPLIIPALGPNGQRDVILHEIAHALCGPTEGGENGGPSGGHTERWKEMAAKIGFKDAPAHDGLVRLLNDDGD